MFARYYASDMIALASEAWLGPVYQITSQVNNVRAHRPWFGARCTRAGHPIDCTHGWTPRRKSG
jgi:hypothetical protein